MTLTPYALPFTQAWQDHGQILLKRQGWAIELASDEGLRGFGDCAPLPSHGTEQPDVAEAMLAKVSRSVRGKSLQQVRAMLRDRHATPAARCGLETALLDLQSQSAEVPLAKHLASDAAPSIKIASVLGPLNRITGQTIERAATAGFDRCKIKVGLSPPETELDQLRRLCALLPSDTRLRLDANRAWTLPQACWLLPRLDELPIEFVEEPLAEPSLESLRQLRAAADCHLALDESLPQLQLTPILEERLVDILVLKPMLQGGLVPSLELATRARQADIDSILTTSLESAIGTWATVHLAAAVQGQRPALAHGLDTSRWLARDLAPSPFIHAAHIRLSGKTGLGINKIDLAFRQSASALTQEPDHG